jgi:GNAT superfamily N-acetyltransferase
LHLGAIVGVHILRIYEEYERRGAHVAGLWVSEGYRGIGIARRLKENGEAWGRRVGPSFSTQTSMSNTVRCCAQRVGGVQSPSLEHAKGSRIDLTAAPRYRLAETRLTLALLREQRLGDANGDARIGEDFC